MMRAIWITKHGRPDVLEVKSGPDPEPGPGEVRVRVRAMGLNFAEIMARQGLYPDAPKPPCVVGYEGAGTIDRVGAGVAARKTGERVLYISKFGGHADTVCVPERYVFPMPERMTFEEGAALPVNYLTAYHMLFVIRRIRRGEQVLVHMAAGGVGTAVLQLCRTVEGVVTYGTASKGKHEYVRQHGCDHPIDYRSADYTAVIDRATGGRGVDLVLDALGGRDWKKGYRLLAPAGMLIAFGMANANVGGKRRLSHVIGQAAGTPLFTPFGLMSDNRAVAGVNMAHLWQEIDLLTAEAEALVSLYDEGKIRPHVGARYRMDQASEAHREIEEGRNLGKVVITTD